MDCENCIHECVCMYDGTKISVNYCSFYEAQRPHGEWKRKNNSNSWFECSVCKEVSDVVTIMREPTWNFCPCCGARMTGEGEEK